MVLNAAEQKNADPLLTRSAVVGTYQQLGGRDGVVGVDAELLRGQRDRLLQLGRQEHAGGSQDLQAALLGGLHRQEAVHVVHGQREDLLLAFLLLAHLRAQTRTKSVPKTHTDGNHPGSLAGTNERGGAFFDKCIFRQRRQK